jgi:hypothetical protein
MPPSGMLRRLTLVRTDVPRKHRFLQEPHGVISQKMVFFRHISYPALRGDNSIYEIHDDPTFATASTGTGTWFELHPKQTSEAET